jgi:F-type H+-transporting ATPase subunit epsilon
VADEQHLLNIEVVTPDGIVYEGRGEVIVVPGLDGELGIMAGHAPLISLLGIGDTRIRNPEGLYEHIATGMGYVEVLFDKVRVVCDHAEEAGAIDVARAEEALTRADERLALRDDPGARAEVDFYRAEQALHRATNRLKVAHSRAGGPKARS